ncbi:MAG: DUF302 domain-containing protein [Planctomycetota bacterium]|jgi:uncharacterized protein (DUF302 family)
MTGSGRTRGSLLPVFAAVLASVLTGGCHGKSEHPKGEHPKGEHPTSRKSEHPKKEHPKRGRKTAASYFFARKLDVPFDEAIERVTKALKGQGFGVLTDIDVKAAMKKKLGVDFRRYRILGACNPPLAYKALTLEDKIGTMLPCNVVVQETADGGVEVAAVDPLASMAAIDNPRLAEVATVVRGKLQAVVDGL